MAFRGTLRTLGKASKRDHDTLCCPDIFHLLEEIAYSSNLHGAIQPLAFYNDEDVM